MKARARRRALNWPSGRRRVEFLRPQAKKALKNWLSDHTDKLCETTLRGGSVYSAILAGSRRVPVRVGIDLASGPDRTAYWTPKP
jgi:hypothetical protein